MNAFTGFYFLTCFIGLSYQSEWSYDYETQWPGICRTGTQQSPINILTRDAVLDQHGAHIRGPLEMRGYSGVNLTGLNNGHTLKWSVSHSDSPVLSGGPLRGNYTLEQFHLHWLSEHAIDGIKYPLEIHFVHVKTGLTIDEALQRPDGLAVIGVLSEVSHNSYSDFALEELMPAVPHLTDRHATYPETFTIDMTRLLSPDPQSYYTYHGSLTTPDCQEVVTWIVMDKTISISDTQFKVLSKVDIGGIDNYRSLQPVNRVVYRSVASSCSKVVPGFLGLLAAFINCTSSSINSIFHKGICAISNFKRKIFGQNIKECTKFSIY